MLILLIKSIKALILPYFKNGMEKQIKQRLTNKIFQKNLNYFIIKTTNAYTTKI
jgi:hypothetical protein